MESNDMQAGLTRGIAMSINAYCRVVEVHLKMVEQGASPELSGPAGETVKMAMDGLRREVEFLRFVRESMDDGREEFPGG